MKKKIKITVSGEFMSGSPAVACLIYRTLRNMGFSAFTSDMNTQSADMSKTHMSKENLDNLSKNCDIEIETKQLSRKQYA